MHTFVINISGDNSSRDNTVCLKPSILARNRFSLLIGDDRPGNEVEKFHFSVGHLLNVKEERKIKGREVPRRK